MPTFLNRVGMTISGSPGQGTITLSAAISDDFFTMAEAGVQDGESIPYLIEEGTDVEIGYGTYTVSGTTLSRDSVTAARASGVASTTKLTLTSAAQVFSTITAEDLGPDLDYGLVTGAVSVSDDYGGVT